MNNKTSQKNLASNASSLQYIAAYSALLGGICMGSVLSYSSPAIPSMQNEFVYDNSAIASSNSIFNNSSFNQTFGHHQNSTSVFLDKNDKQLISWIISIICLGGLLGSLLAGSIIDMIGHCYFLSVSSLLCSIGWIIISFAVNPSMVIIGRFITGFSVGFLSTSVPVYIVEISTMTSRGFLGCCFQSFFTLGTLFISFAGMFFDWRHLALLCSIPSFVLLLTINFFPESPFWLIKKARKTDALKSLKKLRTKSSNCTDELNQIIEQIKHAHESIDDNSISDQESIITSKLRKNTVNSLRSGDGGSMKMINESIANINKIIDNFNSNDEHYDNSKSNESTIKSSDKSANNYEHSSAHNSFLSDLKLPHIYKPLIFGLIIMFYQQMSGANGLFGSLEMILNSAKLNMFSEQQAAFLVNLCFAFFAWLSAFIINLLGRKKWLMLSSIGYIISYLLIGGYYWMKEHNYNDLTDKLNILPLIALILFFFVHAVGYGSVCWFIIPEMAINYRNQISSICVCFNWIMSFVVMKNFTILIDLINYSGTFLFFAFVGFLSAITVLFIPETKDRSAKQIKSQFYSK